MARGVSDARQCYAAWIEDHVQGAGYGDCFDYSLEMLAVFPELRMVRGYYHCPIWGARTHWWLIDPAGKVVDPTAAQFPSKGGGRYQELTDAEIRQLPIGPCANCGGPRYEGQDTVCSEECGRAYIAYVNSYRI